MTFTLVSANRDDLLSAIDLVFHSLELYKGEEIVAHQHPVHHAIVKLERLCRENAKGDAKQSAKLHSPLDTLWFRMLWASREGLPNAPIDAPNRRRGFLFRNDYKGENADPELALKWSARLVQRLEVFRSCVDAGSYHARMDAGFTRMTFCTPEESTQCEPPTFNWSGTEIVK